MKKKVFFIGNPFGGDDGIGPLLYKELISDPQLEGFEMLELGVIGLDMISYVEEGDSLIIVDAVKSDTELGKVSLLGEDDLNTDFALVSQHDFGIEQTVPIIRAHVPGIRKISVVGINVKDINAFSYGLSEDIKKMLPAIKKEVVKKIKEAGA